MSKICKCTWLGTVGAWLCDRYTPRPATKAEVAANKQYASLMIDALKGDISFYGRDREEGDVPVVSMRRG